MATAIKTFKPTDANDYLLPGVKIGTVDHGGTCMAGSEVVGEAGFRCFSANNYVLDPCFPTFMAGTEVVTCIDTPWATSVTEMVPSAPLPTLQNAGSANAQAPPYVQLVNGARCSVSTGAGDTYEGQPVTFYCDDHLALLGSIGGQGLLRTAAVVHVSPTYKYTWDGIYEVAIEWLPKPDTTEPSPPSQSLSGSAIASYIEQQTGDSSVQCPQSMPITVGATYNCGGNETSYTVTIASSTGEYTISYS